MFPGYASRIDIELRKIYTQNTLKLAKEKKIKIFDFMRGESFSPFLLIYQVRIYNHKKSLPVNKREGIIIKFYCFIPVEVEDIASRMS